jgi:glycopeptide antibiotics resistance protein
MLSTRWRSWLAVAALGLAVSLVVEVSQLAISRAVGFPWRVFDVDDLLLNTVGAVAGFAAWRLGSRLARGAEP